MCSAEKCCFVIPLYLGNLLIGFVTFIISMVMTISSAVFLNHGFDNYSDNRLIKSGQHDHPIQSLFEMNLSKSSIQIIFYVTLSIGFLMMVASIFLVIGLYKKRPGFVLCFFTFGVFFTIFLKLSALLLLLQQKWAISLILFLGSLIYIHFLVVVHTVYESMLSGKMFDFNELREEDDPFADTNVLINDII